MQANAREIIPLAFCRLIRKVDRLLDPQPNSLLVQPSRPFLPFSAFRDTQFVPFACHDLVMEPQRRRLVLRGQDCGPRSSPVLHSFLVLLVDGVLVARFSEPQNLGGYFGGFIGRRSGEQGDQFGENGVLGSTVLVLAIVHVFQASCNLLVEKLDISRRKKRMSKRLSHLVS